MRNILINKKNILLHIIQDLIFTFSTSLLFALPWSLYNYPLQHPLTVFFVLSSNTEGADSNTINSILFGFVIPTIIVYIIYKIIYLCIYKKNPVKIFKIMQKFNLIYLTVMTILCLFFLKIFEYPFIIYENYKKPENSSFYTENFINPKTTKILVPDTKRNLITIFVESLETSYISEDNGGIFEQNLIPNLTELAKNNINFSHTEKIGGGVNLEGTSWTVAGLLSKMSGVPYFNPFGKDSNQNKTCLNNAIILSDILDQYGYTQIFAMGSEKQFEDRDILLENHKISIHDLNYYKNKNIIPQDYHVFWGIEDYKLFEIAKEELTNLGKEDKPFSYSLLTVDSHFPSGFTCNECETKYDKEIMNVIACTDKQVSSFINWIQNQSWYPNTTVVILGDHCYLDAPLNNFIKFENKNKSNTQISQSRKFYNVFINSAKQIATDKTKNREFSSFDMYPTILEALGFEINAEGLALGRSLFNDSKTLLEKYGIETVTSETMKRTIQYESLK